MSNNQMGEPFGSYGSGYSTPPGVGEFPGRAPRPAEDRDAKRGSKRGKGRQEKPSNATKRLLNKQRVFALTFAVVAGLLAYTLSTSAPEETYVVRTTANIPALSTITTNQVEAVALPVDAIEEGAITAGSEAAALEKVSLLLAEGRVRMSLPKGHQLHLEDFSADVELSTPLGPDERILAIEAGVVAAVGGQLRAGDRVDVVVVVDIDNRTVSNLVASDIEILSTLPGEQQFNAVAQEQVTGRRDEAGKDLLPTDPVPGIYNVRVTVSQAVTLAAAITKGELVLVLRGKDAQTGTTAAVVLDEVIGQPAPAPTAPATGTAPVDTTPPSSGSDE